MFLFLCLQKNIKKKGFKGIYNNVFIVAFIIDTTLVAHVINREVII